MTRTYDRSHRPQRRSLAQTTAQGFYWLAILGAIIACLWNLQPYLKVSQWGLITVFGVDVQDPDALGVAAANFLRLVGFFMGAVVWALLQMAESYPILLQHDRRTLRQAVLEAETSGSLPIRDGDDPALVQVKTWYNRLPLQGIRVALRAALVAYVIDGLICITQYPPIDGGFSRLMFALLTGQTNLINWANVGLIVSMMFGFQVLLKLILWLGRQAFLHYRAYSAPTTNNNA